MALDATGTPTSPDSIPKYNTAVDPPSGKGFNAAMDQIQVALSARTTALADKVDKPSGIVSGEVPVWNGAAWVRSSVTGVSRASLATTTRKMQPTTVQTPSVGYWPDGVTNTFGFVFTIPDDYVSGDLTFKTLIMSDAAGNNIRVQRSVLRNRAAVAQSVIDSGVQTTVAMNAVINTTTDAYSVAIAAANFQVGDSIFVEISRLGADALDTNTGNAFLRGAWVEYTGRV